MPIDNLEDMKKALYKVFNEAMERHGDYEDGDEAYESTPSNFTIANRTALGTLATAIAEVEKEIRESKGLSVSRLPKTGNG